MEISTQSMYAGYISGVSGLLVGHPLDSMRVILQNGDQNNKRKISLCRATEIRMQEFTERSKATSQQIRGAPSRRTLLHLYSGIGAPMITVGLVQGFSFCIYDSTRSSLRRYRCGGDCGCYGTNAVPDTDPLLDVGIAAAIAGGAISVITSPLVLIKTKQQVMVWSIKESVMNTWQMQTTYGHSRWRNFYTGYPVHMICDSIRRALFFPTYEYLKRTMVQHKSTYSSGRSSHEFHPAQRRYELTIEDRMATACLAGMIAHGLTHPVDVVKSRIFAHSAMFPEAEKSVPSTAEMVTYLWSKGGIRSFFRGFSVAVIRSGPISAVTMPVYDLSLKWLAAE